MFSLMHPIATRLLTTAGFLYRAGAETPLNFREKFRVFSQNDFGEFLRGGYPNRSSGIDGEVWISAPDTQTPIFLGFLGIHS